MSFLNKFRTKSAQPASFVDSLDQADEAVTAALSVFTVAKSNLQKALAHYADVVADADDAIDHYKTRKALANESSETATNVLANLDAITAPVG